MLQSQQIEELISLISTLDRATLIEQFQQYQASFPVDFTRDFLEQQPLERLRHLFLALCLQQQRMPPFPAPADAA
ncbi:MAG TPA: hypothetical protein VNL70_00090 [Tepidisphaeraceae bacterium]|nr:hypothetical protein [Tepidisphaeraceae bacterium]